MPFIASNGLTEAASSKSIAAGGMNVHYHEVGDGEPVLFLHSYGPGTTALEARFPDRVTREPEALARHFSEALQLDATRAPKREWPSIEHAFSPNGFETLAYRGRLRARGRNPAPKVEFATDSSVEETGIELLVPLEPRLGK